MSVLRFIKTVFYNVHFCIRSQKVKREVVSYWNSLTALKKDDNGLCGMPCYYRNVGIRWEIDADERGVRAVFYDYSKRSKKLYEVFFQVGERQVLQHEYEVEIASKNDKDTILICVPHCDDEFFLAGGLIRKKVIEGSRVCIVFCCNNDRGGQEAFEERHGRALQALKILGILRENIFCLGYSNGNFTEKSIYFARNGEVVENKAHINKTYGTKFVSDYHSLRYGEPALFSWENMRGDLVSLIVELMPREIYGIDMDRHIDHVLCSLLLEEAVGIIVKKLDCYTPKIYKGFAYKMSAYGKQDLYKGKRVRPTQRTWRYFYQLVRKGYGLDNPRYCWKDRVRIINPMDCQIRNVKENVLISAFLNYRLMYGSIASFVNEDTVFWERYTDNLALKAAVEVSDGNPEYLNDFKTLDISDLRKKTFDRKCWSPQDNDRKCSFKWSEKQIISEIIIYQNMNFLRGIKKIRVEAENFSAEYNLKGNCTGDKIALNLAGMTEWLAISLVSTSMEYGIDEIEVFSCQKRPACVQEGEPILFARDDDIHRKDNL